MAEEPQMVRSANALQTPRGAEGDPKIIGVSLAKLALWLAAFQLAIDWIVYFIFAKNIELSRAFHSSFSQLDDVTPALAQLKELYRAPLDGREFAQAFSIYLVLLACMSFYFAALLTFLIRLNALDIQWRQAVRPVNLIFLFLLGWGIYEVVFFLVGPSNSLKAYHGIFGSDFIRAICFLLPVSLFLILSSLALYYAIGVIRIRQSISR